jgi:DNA repair exonuclease SbcCD nuclease subunit
MKNNILFIGDMHVKKDNLIESDRLIDFAIETAVENNAYIIFSGDQYNDHSIIHASVLDFWKKAYAKIKAVDIDSCSLVGNHDLSSDYKHSPMFSHSDYTKVILEPCQISRNIGGVGYVKNHEDFITQVMGLYNGGVRLVFCHAEFDGASFDNGFYIPNGIKISDFPSDLTFVSGHIHSRQELSSNGVVRVYYSGTPRMLTRSDLSKEKTIMLIDPSNVNKVRYIPVPPHVCEPFTHVVVTCLEDLANIPDSDRSYVDIKGSKEFIASVIDKIPESVKVRTIPDTEKLVASSINETDGINVAFAGYLNEYIKEHKIEDDQFLTQIFDYLPSWRNA